MRIYSCLRDIVAWSVLHHSAGVQFDHAEVDMDATKAVIDRSTSDTANIHCGRIFIMKERASGKRKVVALNAVAVSKGDPGRPERNSEVAAPISQSMMPGSIGAGDGGQAFKSCVVKSADGKVPFVYAQHGRKPRRQFTRLEKISRDDICPELQQVLQSQDRWDPQSSSVKVTGGNQAAEGAWGTSNMMQKQRCVHRGAAKRTATANMICSMFLAHSPGLVALGGVVKSWITQHVDKADPASYFSSTGWSGVGCDVSVDGMEMLFAGAKSQTSQALIEFAARVAKKRPAKTPCAPNKRQKQTK